jgi:polyisoprenoid-binding protein YceI
MTTTLTSAPGRTVWSIDDSHSAAEFAVKHLMISTVKGHFGAIKGTVEIDEWNPKASAVDVTIDATSIDTRNAQRDAHLRSPDFFDAERFPALRFVGRRIEGDVTTRFKVTGDLTIRDVTRAVTLDVKAGGHVRDPWGNERSSYAAETKINRSDWGLTWNQALETGGVVVSDEVKIAIEVELTRAESVAEAA